jgi:cysteine synthase B
MRYLIDPYHFIDRSQDALNSSNSEILRRLVQSVVRIRHYRAPLMAQTRALSHSSFLSAERNLEMPVVQLPAGLLPIELQNRGIALHAALGFYTPSHNIKYIPASYMLERALGDPSVTKACTLVESSSGNFVLSLAACARVQGLKVTAIVSDDLPDGKLQPLIAGGIHVMTESEARNLIGSNGSAVQLAALMGQREGWINLGQYTNTSNPESYAKLLAPSLIEALQGRIQVFAAALGSTGTLVGLGGSLKKAIPSLKTIAVIPHLGEHIPGCRDDRRLKEVTHDWRSCADFLRYVEASNAYKASLALWNAGIPAGPSSGAALVGVCDFLLRLNAEGGLSALRNVEGTLNCLFPCADTLYPYWGEALRYACDSPSSVRLAS